MIDETGKVPDAKGDTDAVGSGEANLALDGGLEVEDGGVGNVESDEDEDYSGPKLEEAEYYALSEAGEGELKKMNYF